MKVLSTLVSALAFGSAKSCDVWEQSTQPKLRVFPGAPFNPLSNSSFASNNTLSNADQARIYFQTGGDYPPFLNIYCGETLSQEALNSSYTACVGTDITADDFTTAVQSIQATIAANVIPGKSVSGYGDYTASECETKPLGNNGTVFYASRLGESTKSVDLER